MMIVSLSMAIIRRWVIRVSLRPFINPKRFMSIIISSTMMCDNV